jgi:NAD(P)-dependent dehydrogenase (short-subunit alcohol dehydrogenase family)
MGCSDFGCAGARRLDLRGTGRPADLLPSAFVLPNTWTVGRFDMTGNRQQAIVIGAGSGLGRSLALRFAHEGYDVALLARDEQRLAGLADEVRETGGSATAVGCDASDLEQVHAAVAGVAERGPVGMLAHNASVFGERLIDTDLVTLQQATNVNVLAPVAAVQAALPSLEAAGGTVLLTGSRLALHPNGSWGLLSLGKAGLHIVAGLLADDLASRGVRVRTLIVDGVIEQGTPFDPDRIAAAFWAFQAEAGDEVARVFTGAVDGPGPIEPR